MIMAIDNTNAPVVPSFTSEGYSTSTESEVALGVECALPLVLAQALAAERPAALLDPARIDFGRNIKNPPFRAPVLDLRLRMLRNMEPGQA